MDMFARLENILLKERLIKAEAWIGQLAEALVKEIEARQGYEERMTGIMERVVDLL